MTNYKHGLCGTSEYKSWQKMRERCLNQKTKNYHNYGGRGISICQRWSSPEVFVSDMGPKPSADYSLDRIDNDGNYEPSNCKWSTQVEQQNNRRSRLASGKAIRCDSTSGHTGVNYVKNRDKWASRITIKGKTKCLGEFKSKQLAIDVRRAWEYLSDYFNGRNV